MLTRPARGPGGGRLTAPAGETIDYPRVRMITDIPHAWPGSGLDSGVRLPREAG